MWGRHQREEIRRLRRQVRRLQEKNSLLQLYPSDRGILRLIGRTGKALRSTTSDAAARALVDDFFDRLPAVAPGAPPSVIVSGPVRSGKSTVGKLICLQSSALYFQFDLLGRFWLAADGVTERVAILEMVIDATCRKFAQGTVIEGTPLIFNGTRTADAMVRHFAGRGIATVMIGSAEASVEDKLDALLHHHRVKKDWTATLDDDALRARAERIVGESVAARRIAAETGIPYFELRVDHFGPDIRRAVNTIIDTFGYG